MDNFKNYSSFDDMKDLYNKTIPQLKQFEQDLHKQEIERRKTEEIILRFDEVISSKASKVQMQQIYKHCERYGLKRRNDPSRYKFNQWFEGRPRKDAQTGRDDRPTWDFIFLKIFLLQ